MKALTVILLIAVCAWGQDITVSDDYIVLPKHYEYYVYNFDSTGEFYRIEKQLAKTIISAVIVDLWDEYAKACYADSHKICMSVYREWPTGQLLESECSNSIMLLAPIRDYDKWIHEQPTFAGFIEWLRKKK